MRLRWKASLKATGLLLFLAALVGLASFLPNVATALAVAVVVLALWVGAYLMFEDD